MYSIEDRDKTLVRFLADSDADIIDIIDDCAPGSTIEVLEEDKVHTFKKAPAGYFVLYDGESDYEPPKNTAKVFVPRPSLRVEATDPALALERVEDLQTGLIIYSTGLMKGTLHPLIVPRYSSTETSHCFYVTLESPSEASTYDLFFGDDTKTAIKSGVKCDGWLMVRMENMIKYTEKDGSTAHTVTIKYNTGESFVFETKDLVLE